MKAVSIRHRLLFAIKSLLGLYFLISEGEMFINQMENRLGKKLRFSNDIATCFAWPLFVLFLTGCKASSLTPVNTGILIFAFAIISYNIIKSESKDKTGKILAVISIAAIALRTFYVLYTGAEQRQHDMGEFDSDLGNNYHAEYIEYLIENHRLLNENVVQHWQFYHPPLHHIICAGFFSIYRNLAPSMAHNWDALQCLSLVYSLITLVLARRFVELWNLSPKGRIIYYLAIAFQPQLIVFAGAINNDPLSVMFAVAALYLTLLWLNDEKKSFLKLMGISVCIGLGMMAKLSAGLIAVPIGFVMLKVFFESSKKARLVWQYAVFLIVCAPLGLWYQVRSYILWKVPLTYVAVPDTVLNPGLVISGVPFWKRFLEFGEGVDYNIIYETLNAAVFDGDYYQEHMLLALIGYALLAAFTVFTITVLANMICCWIKDRSIMNLIMTILVVAEIASYISFCFKYPYTCTMSFRYIVPTLIAGAYYSGRSKEVSPNLLSLITTISVWALALVSFVFHCLIWIKG